VTSGLDLRFRGLGLNFSEGKGEFLLWAPFAEKTEVIINGEDGNNLVPDGSGYWKLSSELFAPGIKYHIKINDKILPDPASVLQPQGVHGPSEAFDLGSFRWEDEGWKGVNQDEVIFYELHTGTFSVKGNFEGIADKLDYLKDLGITAIELMPVAQFPGSRNWGYDGVYPFAVQNSYGGPSALQNLVNSCHLKGLAVVLDVVYNHLGPEGNYLHEYGPYFTDKYKTPWGKAINFDDEWCDGVRRYYVENMLMWLRDFHFDGLRLDAVHAIKDFSAKHIITELHEKATELENITGRKYLLIGEIDLNDTRYINPVVNGGYGLNMQWCDEFHHALHSLVTGERNGYYSDFGDTWHLAKSLNEAYVYDGIYSPHRKRTFGSRTEGIPGNKFVVFTQNHDHIGNRMMGERLGQIIGFETLKLVAGILFISPFVPLLFMGEEYNEPNPFLYFTSHSDKDLQQLVKEGRSREFKDLIGADVPDPQSEDVFDRSKITFDISGERKLIIGFYRELIRLKKTHPVWKSFDRSNTNASSGSEKSIIFVKKSNGYQLIALMNFNSHPVQFDLPESGRKFITLINSADLKWGGGHDETIVHNKVNIMPSSIIVISDFPDN
jgi:maltooligosyltrehalose trehalohydrolase